MTSTQRRQAMLTPRVPLSAGEKPWKHYAGQPLRAGLPASLAPCACALRVSEQELRTGECQGHLLQRTPAAINPISAMPSTDLLFALASLAQRTVTKTMDRE